ncbi:MAG: hypothetical protein ACTSXP_08225 [Promethearchaeota archaeon]
MSDPGSSAISTTKAERSLIELISFGIIGWAPIIFFTYLLPFVVYKVFYIGLSDIPHYIMLGTLPLFIFVALLGKLPVRVVSLSFVILSYAGGVLITILGVILQIGWPRESVGNATIAMLSILVSGGLAYLSFSGKIQDRTAFKYDLEDFRRKLLVVIFISLPLFVLAMLSFIGVSSHVALYVLGLLYVVYPVSGFKTGTVEAILLGKRIRSVIRRDKKNRAIPLKIFGVLVMLFLNTVIWANGGFMADEPAISWVMLGSILGLVVSIFVIDKYQFTLNFAIVGIFLEFLGVYITGDQEFLGNLTFVAGIIHGFCFGVLSKMLFEIGNSKHGKVGSWLFLMLFFEIVAVGLSYGLQSLLRAEIEMLWIVIAISVCCSLLSALFFNIGLIFDRKFVLTKPAMTEKQKEADS